MNDNDYEDDEGQVVEWEEGSSLAESDNTGTAAVEIVGKIFEYAREKTITKREIERYRAMRDVAITQITEKYKFAREYMNKTFAERRMVIEKQFEVIDKGLETHDYQLVNAGLQHVTAIVKDSPFKLFQISTPDEGRHMIEDGGFSLR